LFNCGRFGIGGVGRRFINAARLMAVGQRPFGFWHIRSVAVGYRLAGCLRGGAVLVESGDAVSAVGGRTGTRPGT
jgi:hypothetical protein